MDAMQKYKFATAQP